MLFLFLGLFLRFVLFLFGQVFVLLRLIVAETAEQDELFLLLRPLFVELIAELVFVYLSVSGSSPKPLSIICSSSG